MNKFQFSNFNKKDSRFNNPDYVYIDCFFYGFFIEKEELKKYQFKKKNLFNVLAIKN